MFKKNTIELKNWNNCTSGELESRREAYLSNTVCIEVMESLASLKTSAKAAGLLKKKSYCRHNQSKIHNQDDDCEATCMHSWAVYWNWKMTISERSLSGTGFSTLDKESQWLIETQEHSKCCPYLERFEVWLPVSVEDPSAWLVFAAFGVSDVSIGRTPSP